MISRLSIPHIRVACAFSWMVVPLLVITLALATTVAVQHGVASADSHAGLSRGTTPMTCANTG